MSTAQKIIKQNVYLIDTATQQIISYYNILSSKKTE